MRNYYPNLTPDPTDPNNIGPVLEEFIQENQTELTNLIQKKIIQTKEVHHCIILISRLNHLRAHGFDKLNLIEIGINGWLNLNVDKYSYEFTRDTIQVLVGSETSGITLRNEIRGQFRYLDDQSVPSLQSKTRH
ncbi:MAG: DUF2332 family protein [Candidatus Heimdallarchaeota archaeon]|nr:DUF2332 family protein [Candidatus Heimdallarchaeota archaeon]